MDHLFVRAAQTREPLESMALAEDLERLRAAMLTLSEKDRRILAMRFGLDGRRVHSSAQVAISQGLSPQHAEMIITAAKVRLLAAFAANKGTAVLRTTKEPLSKNTSTTPTMSLSPKSSPTEVSQTRSVKNVDRSPKTD